VGAIGQTVIERDRLLIEQSQLTIDGTAERFDTIPFDVNDGSSTGSLFDRNESFGAKLGERAFDRGRRNAHLPRKGFPAPPTGRTGVEQLDQERPLGPTDVGREPLDRFSPSKELSGHHPCPPSCRDQRSTPCPAKPSFAMPCQAKLSRA
jgi:hypothetical protein